MPQDPNIKKQESELTPEQLENAAGGARKADDVTLKRGSLTTADDSGQSKGKDVVDSTVAHDDWQLDDAS